MPFSVVISFTHNPRSNSLKEPLCDEKKSFTPNIIGTCEKLEIEAMKLEGDTF